ncbi:XtrA/YqaO family protein [Sporosarcina luteola]|uniref:XtrA/YqaO family protein n=1 Tax=Sporosarcina luteola TaxID=582850 RepID=UPI00203C1A42|nr:XtrA/YqaO family protein [Sporosarcina luteola]MCM3712012.1 XtrA/YqaO family protein [Sporosarcina luteola]
MRLKEINIDTHGILNIDIMELPASCVIVLSEGRAKVAELPPHAETTIKTFKGKVTRIKCDKGEDF